MTLKAAFQGIAGAYSELACRQTFGPFFGQSLLTEAYPSFTELVTAIAQKKADYGLLPIENAVAGTVLPAYQALLQQPVPIQGLTSIRICHHLLAKPGSTLRDISTVYSHPQALAQCQRFLCQHQLNAQNYFDTAGAAHHVQTHTHQNIAAIASKQAAETYGLAILVSDIADEAFNRTRFFILGELPLPWETKALPKQTSLVFGLKDQPSALLNILQAFCEQQINLTKIESHPSRQKAWHYDFFLDCQGEICDRALETVLQKIQTFTTYLQVLGSYPILDIAPENNL